MKQRTQWIAALFMAASASLGVAGPGTGFYGPYGSEGVYGGFGPYARCVRLEPVGERIVTRQVVYSQPMIRQTCLMNTCPTSTYSTPGQFVGNAITAPFRLVGSGLSWTGRTLSGQPAVVGSLEPVGERYTTVRVIRSRPILEPVGERFTTVRVIRSQPILEPVGERFTTVRVIRHRAILQPVGEKITVVHKVHKPMLKPVGEKFTTTKHIKTVKYVKHHKVMLKKVTYQREMLLPVGERIKTYRVIRSQPWLEPVGERTWIRTTRIYSHPACGCP